MNNGDMEVKKILGPGTYQFSAIKMEKLGATEYTLVTIVLDVTGSVRPFADSLLDLVKTVISACKDNPRSENLLVRFTTFDDNVTEVHGFKPIADIDENDYEKLNPYGRTALFEATSESIRATLTQGEDMTKEGNDYDVNAAIYIITDGMDNASNPMITPASINGDINGALRQEDNVESLTTILIGLKDATIDGDAYAKNVATALTTFKDEAGLTDFINFGEVTDSKLAKLGNLISESISSVSQGLANPGSQPVSQQLVF